MGIEIEALRSRPPAMDDAQCVWELMVMCDIGEFGEQDSSLDDLLYDWGRIDLARDAWLVLTVDETLVGYGAVVPWISDFRYDVYVDPEWMAPDLGGCLLARCESRAASLNADVETGTGGPTGRVYIASVNTRDRQTMQAAGFELARHHFQMQISLQDDSPDPEWPTGTSVRAPVPGQDDRAIHELVQTAFDGPGREPQPFDDWKSFLMRKDLFDPEIWFLAIADDEIVGVCLGVEYPNEGWVRQLAVAADWRRRGLGTALLRQAFVVFRQRGLAKVGLAVDGANSNACRFYEDLGMSAKRHYEEYRKPVGTPVVQSHA